MHKFIREIWDSLQNVIESLWNVFKIFANIILQVCLIISIFGFMVSFFGGASSRELIYWMFLCFTIHVILPKEE